IENAVLGVYLGKEGNCCAYSGGIIQTDYASAPEDRVVFRSNRKHVAFGPYDFNSQSYFKDTDFLCDGPMADYEAYNGDGTQQYVSIWAQDRIRFIDCTFKNAITYTDANGDPQEFDDLHRGYGIRAIDAHVIVSNGCDFIGL